MDQRLSPVGGLDVLNVGHQGLLGLIEPSGVVGYLCLALLGEVGDLYLGLLLDFHQVLLDLLDLGQVLGDLLVVLLLLQVLLELNLFDVDVEVLLLFKQFSELVLVFELVSDKGIEFLGGSIFNELD